MTHTHTHEEFEDEDRIDPKRPGDLARLADDLEEILTAFGWDMTNPSIENTPMRFLKYLAEFHKPFDLEDVLGTPFKSPDTSMVIQDGIPFRMICEHHLLPAIGHATVGYIPSGNVVGLSKLTRLVQAVGTMKPSLQEHINDTIAEMLDSALAPKGVMVVIEAEHGCMACRGVNAPGVITRTSSTRGVFLADGDARHEFLMIAKMGVERRG